MAISASVLTVAAARLLARGRGLLEISTDQLSPPPAHDSEAISAFAVHECPPERVVATWLRKRFQVPP